MIWKLMKERKDDKDQVQIAQSESHTIGERSAQEIAKWKKMSNEFLEKFEQCDEELYHAQNRVKEEQDRLVRSGKSRIIETKFLTLRSKHTCEHTHIGTICRNDFEG